MVRACRMGCRGAMACLWRLQNHLGGCRNQLSSTMWVLQTELKSSGRMESLADILSGLLASLLMKNDDEIFSMFFLFLLFFKTY